MLSKIAKVYLTDNFQIRDSDAVFSFIENNIHLMSVLRETPTRVKEILPDAKVALSVFKDPEGQDAPYLLGIIISKIPLLERVNVQNKLAEDWWLDTMYETKGNFQLEL